MNRAMPSFPGIKCGSGTSDQIRSKAGELNVGGDVMRDASKRTAFGEKKAIVALHYVSLPVFTQATPSSVRISQLRAIPPLTPWSW